MRQQRLEALRHVEIDRRRDLLRLRAVCGNRAGQRLAVVDIERAAIVEHQVEIVVAAEGVAPRQPVDDHRRLVGDEGEAGAQHRLVRAQHALGVDDALGLAGRARGEQEFGDGVGADLGVRGVDRGGRLGREQIGERRGEAAAERIDACVTISTSSGTAASIARANGVPSVANTSPGVRVSMIDLQLAEIARHQRIGRRDRRIGNAGIHRASASSACSMSLPERMAIGRSAERSRDSSACAMPRTCASVCA